MISLSLTGLVLIVIAWLIQFFFMKKNKIIPLFIIVYIVGVAILIYDGFASGMRNTAIANLMSLIAAGLVLINSLKTPGK